MSSSRKRQRIRLKDLLSAGAAILTMVIAARLILGPLLPVETPIVIRPTQNAIALVEHTIDLRAASHGEFPTGGDEVLAELTRPGQLNGKAELPCLVRVPKDGWGRPLHYRWPNDGWSTSERPAIWSDGANGVNELGYGDDIRGYDLSLIHI